MQSGTKINFHSNTPQQSASAGLLKPKVGRSSDDVDSSINNYKVIPKSITPTTTNGKPLLEGAPTNVNRFFGVRKGDNTTPEFKK